MLNFLLLILFLTASLQAAITPISGGASNVNYKLEFGGETLFMRVAPKEQEAYFADIAMEYEVLKGIEALGISPKPHFFDANSKLLVTSFIPHRQQRVNLLDRKVRQEVMQHLHAIEALDVVIPRTFMPYEQTMHLASLVGDQYKAAFERQFGAILQKIDATLAKNPKKTLCHLDLHGLNVLQGDERLWIVDWEYAMMSHPFLTLASMASIERWDDEEMGRLLEDYMGSYTEDDFELLYLYRIAIDLFWTAWNELQSKISSIDNPYPVWKQLFEDAAKTRIAQKYPSVPVIILFGPPGAGKGTFADCAVARGYNHLSAGDLIRDEIRNQTAFGKEVEEIVRRGEYVDPEALFRLVRERIIELKQAGKPFIIDGYGRNDHDILALCNLLIEENLQNSTVVLWLDADDEVCKGRIPTRLVCSNCHHVYSTVLDDVAMDSACDYCATGVIELRLNDSPEATEKRLKKYREEIVFSYQKAGLFFPMLSLNTHAQRDECLERYNALLNEMSSESFAKLSMAEFSPEALLLANFKKN
ncbi:MAG: nucleoside monophosphate kinase [Verrucomicrobia bacterium]|nr:nucleoside monophosphate kinase [Verrucomicrobiota bacterium]